MKIGEPIACWRPCGEVKGGGGKMWECISLKFGMMHKLLNFFWAWIIRKKQLCVMLCMLCFCVLIGDWDGAQRHGSKSIVVWESDDLVNWSSERLVRVSPDVCGNTWAPKVTYDEDLGVYVVYWASKLYVYVWPGTWERFQQRASDNLFLSYDFNRSAFFLIRR